ncbi:hypothetical protein B0H14DRAFT_2640301, partial [Mycena olivaceomarginata]
MAPPKSVELFRGNCVAEKAHVWLRTLEGTWRYDTKEEEKLYQFEKGLHPGGQADEWFSELRAGEKYVDGAARGVREEMAKAEGDAAHDECGHRRAQHQCPPPPRAGA